jgi:hypothetical protein
MRHLCHNTDTCPRTDTHMCHDEECEYIYVRRALIIGWVCAVGIATTLAVAGVRVVELLWR